MAVQKTVRIILAGGGLLALALLAGCKNKEQKALDQAKTEATSTNTPQQVQYVDKNGNTVTKTVEPPAAAGEQPYRPSSRRHRPAPSRTARPPSSHR